MSVTCECGKVHENVIPKDRFDQVYRERRDLKAEVGTLQGKIEELGKAGEGLESIKTTNEQLREKLAQAEQRFDTFQVFTNHGITDPLTMRMVQVAVPDGATLADTLSGWKETPDTMPPALRPVLTPPQAAQPPAGQPPASGADPAAAQPPAPPTPGAQPPTPAQPAWQPQQWAANQGTTPAPAPATTTDFDFRKNPEQIKAAAANPDSEFSQLLHAKWF